MQLVHSNFFIFRIPLLPVRDFLITNQAKTEQQLSENIRDLIIHNRQILSALIVSSYDIGKITKSWIDHDTNLNQKQLLSIYKYLARMSIRPTPFGLSAGIGVGSITDGSTEIEIFRQAEIHSRLSMAYLISKLKSKTLDPKCFSDKLSLSSTLYEHAGHYRFAKTNANSKSNFDRVKIKKNPLLNLVVKKIDKGINYFSLLQSIIESGFDETEAEHYLKQLIEIQFIITPIEPSLIGNSYRTLLSKSFTDKTLNSNINNRIDLDHNKMIEYWADTSSKVNENLIPEVEVNMLFSSKKANINSKTIHTISKELSELQSFCPFLEMEEMEHFKEKFKTKYDLMEIPLLEIMDSDLSIGYGIIDDQYRPSNPLLQSLSLNRIEKGQQFNLADLVVEKFTGFDNKNIDLKIPDHLKIKPSHSNQELTPTSFVMGQLFHDSSDRQNEIENFSFILKTWSGPSAINLMTRFAYMNDSLNNEIKQLADFEQNTLNDFIFAEVAYSPSGKDANILQRPSVYNYEIPVLGSSTTEEKYRITLQDLFVSVKNNKVYLRSKRLNKYIIPKISSAHNYKRTNPIYRFLGDLQRHHLPFHFSWNWGDQNENSFLPRVTFKHLILSRARWYISFEDSRDYNDQLIFQLRDHLQIDKEVLIAESDNELYIDLDTSWGRKILLNSMQNGPVTLFEFINTGKNFIKDSGDNGFTNEIIVPFTSNNKCFILPHSSDNKDNNSLRTFPPGSDWTYIKIYCAPSEADGILLVKINKIISTLINNKIIQKWFFIRYSDPQHHLRIRFFHPGNSLKNHGYIVNLITTVLQPLFENKQIFKLQYDTYEREIERYEGSNIEHFETIFFYSSRIILKILSLANNYNENFKWKIAIKNIDTYFSSFGIPLYERISTLEKWTSNFSTQFSLSKNDLKKIKLNYRNVREELAVFLSNRSDESSVSIRITNQQKQHISKILKNIPSNQRRVISSKLDSIIHMHLNRLFYSDQRATEMVIYFYLLEVYKSEFAQNKLV